MVAPVASGTLAGSTSGSWASNHKEAAGSDCSRLRRHPRVIGLAHLCRPSRSRTSSPGMTPQPSEKLQSEIGVAGGARFVRRGRRGAASRRSSVSSRRLWGAHSSVIAGGHDHRSRRDYRNRGIAAARFERARQRKHSRRAESPILGSGWKRSRDVASPYCCSDEPARGPSACSRPGGGRLSKRITIVWAQSLRLAKHQRGSGSPASMASDSWIAASMRQSDAEIDTIAARPRQEPARGPVGLAQSQGERHSPRDRGRGCRDCSQAAAEGSLLLLDRRGSG